ncbi:hypothetical protein [Natronorarus salvus]|uniref:hypothetical protein n=1 Tax=Natronorarus salvus TaxID=3117733 RepID=UPI002F26BA68
MDELRPGRRRFLELAAGSSAVALAGCSDVREALGGEETESVDVPSGEATVTAAVEPSDEALAELEAEVIERVEEGEIDQMEAQAEFQEGRQELIAEAAESFERSVDSETEVAIEDSIAEFGAYLVTGEPAELIGLLSLETVGALVSGEVFDEIGEVPAEPPEEAPEDVEEDELENGDADDEVAENDTDDGGATDASEDDEG